MKSFLIKSILYTGILVCAINSHAQVAIKGQIKGMKTDSVIVFTYDLKTDKKTRDTLVWKKGKISLNYPTTNLMQVIVYEKPAQGHRITTADGLNFYLIPGKTMTVSGTLSNLTIKGCETYDKVDAFLKGKAEIQNKLNDIKEIYSKELELAKTDDEKQAVVDKYGPTIRKYADEIRTYNLNFIKENPDNKASCIAICNTSDFYQAYNLMTDRVKNCELALAYKYTKNTEDFEKKRQEQEKKVAEGTIAPDFTLKDINGNDFTLSTMRGKYVMLDFWGSWCGWCIKALPKMKEYYAKYKDSGKFEIVSIDCRDPEEKWKAAVKKNDMTWIQVKNEDKDNIPTLYAVPGYPTFVIINPEGKTIKRFIGEDSEMYKFIDSLFE